MGGSEDRTEAATPKRRGDARNKGNVAKSTEISTMTVFLALLLVLHSAMGGITGAVRGYFELRFLHLDQLELSSNTVMHLGGQAILVLLRAIGPIVLTAMVAGILVNVAQTGPLWATEGLKPNFNRLNPLTGAKRFVSSRSLVELVKSLYKIGIICYVVYSTVVGSYAHLMTLTRLEPMAAIAVVLDLAYHMALRVAVTLLVLASLDYFYQRWAHEKSLKMTKEEIRQEHKQLEANPQIKSRIRARQKQMARKRMMSEIPLADVLLTNPTHFAVALRYESHRNGAPIVVAKGQDLIALRIREIAQQNDVPIVENPPLARALYKLVPIGQEIPGDLYEAVAEVLAFVYQINQQRRERAGLALT